MQQKIMEHTSMFMQVLLGVSIGRAKACMKQKMFSLQMNRIVKVNMIKVHLMQYQEQQQTMVFTEEVSSAVQQFMMKMEIHIMFLIGRVMIKEKELHHVFLQTEALLIS